ncbi:aldehyde dehydrogenase family protein [Rhizobium sp. DKSPLA3]|uniref:Aldehyde dehydrogenase family protein n=1 Tax=Rhizobium quercicola TaxID=2901226 RepID=A0A9X1NNF8_9HYPH|nr:aldehyde dehydrogenase family protein [Rhizobium quercicola]MCD7107805.1 aldehyde dehydrogenase family protein [Rhizobium quercicola]
MTFELTIDGAGETTATFIDIVDPSTGAVTARAPCAGAAELDRAVAAARRAFPAWRETPPDERRRLVGGLGDILAAHAEELVALDILEGGKPHAVAAPVLDLAVQWVKALATLEIPVRVLDDNPDRRVEVHHEPLGVVGAIAPWNFPVFLSVWKLASALIAGCTVVLKPSPLAPLAVLRMGSLIRDQFPKGVVNVLSGDDALGPLMTAHEGFDKISFTGSTATGRKVMESAAPTLKRLTLELGGNDAALVFPDVSLDAVAPALFWSAMGNSGQVCIATKRIYVHDDIYDDFIRAMRLQIDATTMGPGGQPGAMLGPIQNAPQFQRLQSLLADCRANAYKLHQGTAPDGNGYFIPATLVENPPHDSRIVREEQFGPILPIVRFSTEDEAIALANDSPMGLTATVWTQDMARARRVAQRLQSGNVWINEASALSPFVPFGGRKQSGVGVENALDGILEYTAVKAITVRTA